MRIGLPQAARESKLLVPFDIRLCKEGGPIVAYTDSASRKDRSYVCSVHITPDLESIVAECFKSHWPVLRLELLDRRCDRLPETPIKLRFQNACRARHEVSPCYQFQKVGPICILFCTKVSIISVLGAPGPVVFGPGRLTRVDLPSRAGAPRYHCPLPAAPGEQAQG